MIRVKALSLGKASDLPYGKGKSGIYKHATAGQIMLTTVGLTGDEQADLRHHGGPEKALHHYPAEHYEFWQTRLNSPGPLDNAGAFGENLSTAGLTEDEVCIGDIFQFGSAMLQISQGRQPCWKLDARFNQPGVASIMQQSGRTGWYYRILEPGLVAVDAPFKLIERTYPAWPLTKLIDLLFDKNLERRNEWARASELVCLSENWRRIFRLRTETMAIEDWTPRLQG